MSYDGHRGDDGSRGDNNVTLQPSVIKSQLEQEQGGIYNNQKDEDE
jgi:hypothetical protein